MKNIPFCCTAAAALVLAAYSAQASAQSTVIFKETFGSTTVRQTSPHVPQNLSGGTASNYYKFGDINSATWADHTIADGRYAVINPTAIYAPTDTAGTISGDWWWRGTRWVELTDGQTDPVTGLTISATAKPVFSQPYGLPTGSYRQFYPTTEYVDGDGSSDGAVLVVNAGGVRNDIYRRVVALTPGKTYKMSAKVLYVQAPGNMVMRVVQADGLDAATALAESAPLIPTTRPTDQAGTGPGPAVPWESIPDLVFKVPASAQSTVNYAVALANRSTVSQGNDLFADNIMLEEVADDPALTPIAPPTATNVVTPKPTPDTGTTPINTPITLPDVRGNDTVTDASGTVVTGVPLANPTITAQSPDGTAAVDPQTGLVTFTPKANFVGVATFSYEVCTTQTAAYPNSACATTTVAVTVPGDATPVADSGTAVSGTPSTPVANVTSNDTVNGGLTATLGASGNATIDKSGTWPAGFTLDTTTGAVSTDASVKPGPYTMDYELCNKATPTPDCKTTTVTITVTGDALPTPDSGTAVAGTPSTPVTNVTSNDKINGEPATLGAGGNATVVTEGNWPTGFTLDTTTGAVKTDATVAVGTYTMDYKLCDKSASPICKTTTVTVVVTDQVAPTPVPTLGAWGVALLSPLFAGFAAFVNRRRTRL